MWILVNAVLEQPAMYRQRDMRSTACKFKRADRGAQDNPFRRALRFFGQNVTHSHFSLKGDLHALGHLARSRAKLR
jgi:hypothetical protein